MAEGLARALSERSEANVEVWSADTEARGVHPLAIKAMAEVGIDISQQRSKTIAEVPPEPDYVITLCDEAAEVCPIFPSKTKRLHWNLPDPSAATGPEIERLGVFRKVRDDIRQRLEEFWKTGISPSDAAKID